MYRHVRPRSDRRAVAPVLGAVLLVALTVALAAVVGVAALSTAEEVRAPADGSPVSLSLSVDAGTDRLTLVHRAGAPLDARRLTLGIRVAGTDLEYQPPVPFFAAHGFRAGPTGPFNPASDPGWTVGERASLRLASTNEPGIDPGDRVVVGVTVGDRRVATLSARG